ncbi:hypothetical protein [Phocaeicola paurosaccharolyticus]|uniref:hypothetical protein n=1 Tax=Phocaeicola paurosaccharolyticus TaxID=732242 RepID=UPI00046AB833|nr:hypothetical protein [Phocaeicola paurosaccharolyticus]
MNTIKNNIKKCTSFANVACVALLAGIMTACADDSTAIDDAVNGGRILAAQVAGVSIQGDCIDGVAARSVASRADAIPQPNKVITDFEEGDVFYFEYRNSVENEPTAYVKKQADGSWNTYSDYEGTTPHTVYLDAQSESTSYPAEYQGFTGTLPAGQTELTAGFSTNIVEGCYYTAAPSGSTHGTLVCYDALHSTGSTSIVTDGNKRTCKLTYAFTHLNYLLTLNVAKTAESTLSEVTSVTCTVRVKNGSGVYEYYDIEATSTGATATTDGINAPQWHVILPPYTDLFEFFLTSIKVKGQLANGSEWNYTADLEKAGTAFATTRGYSRTATLTVDDRATLTLGAAIDSWTSVDGGNSSISHPGIRTAADLVAFRDEWNTNGAAGNYSNWTLSGGAPTAANPVVLANDIDLQSVCSESLAKSWTPIGTSTMPFTCGFNGLGHTIKNMYINQTLADNGNYGLFGFAEGAYIENVTLDKPVVKAITGNVGALIGLGGICKFIACTVSNPTIALQGDGTNVGNIGGIVGSNNGGCIAVCRVIGTTSITGVSLDESATGGIVGVNTGTEGYVFACYANVSTLTGSVRYTGSIVGLNMGNVFTCIGNSATILVVGTSTAGNISNLINITGTDFNSVVGTYSTSYTSWADAKTLNAVIGVYNPSWLNDPVRYIFQTSTDGLPQAVRNYDLQLTY